MLYLQSFTFNPFQENTYVIFNEKNECWIVDPGMYDSGENQQLFDFISSKELVPQAIINTHAHIDHILGVQAVSDKYKTPFALHEKETPVLNMASGSAAMFGISFHAVIKASFYINETEGIKLGNEYLDVKFVPGHSPGSIAFYYEPGKWAIAGDVLFANSIGRTDLPGGDFDSLIASIKNELFVLPDDTRIHPGHGPSTTIGYEKKHNPFLQGA